MYLFINNSLTETVTVELPKDAERYTLSAEHMRASVMKLNGQELTISDKVDLPELVSAKQAAGKAELVPGSCTFFVM